MTTMLLTLTLLSTLHAVTPADSLAGTWKFTNEVQGVSWTEVCTFKQTGATVGGSCVGDAGTPMAITGEVKGDSVTFQHPSEYQGQAITIIFSGTIEKPGALKKGTIFVKPLDAGGTFTAAPESAAK
jgi:hypothetical protein